MAEAGDDQLTSEEIEALLTAGDGDAAPQSPEDAGAKGTNAPAGTQDGGPSARPEPRGGNAAGSPGTSTGSTPDELLDQVEANLNSAFAPELEGQASPKLDLPPEFSAASPFQLQSFDDATSDDEDAAVLGSLDDVELDVRIELGRTELLIDEVLRLKQGSVVPLDKLAGDPVDILVNGRLIARGEVLVMNDNFCVRVAEVLTPEL